MAATDVEKGKKLSEYLRREFGKFVARRLGRGESTPSQVDFARYLGVPDNSLSYWMNGIRFPGRDNVDRMAEKLGPELYAVLDIPPRMPNDRLYKAVSERWHRLNDAQKREIVETIKNMLSEEEF